MAVAFYQIASAIGASAINIRTMSIVIAITSTTLQVFVPNNFCLILEERESLGHRFYINQTLVLACSDTHPLLTV